MNMNLYNVILNSMKEQNCCLTSHLILINQWENTEGKAEKETPFRTEACHFVPVSSRSIIFTAFMVSAV